ncbi:beta-L-arabinofuranosidase domain-containing protein [Sphingobacterium sp. HJSM2_6]|uniref:beta-L-arabinofuranosidase domain-containing protein n=1 Tax=Sphingobacterium sp. HJSM2_6 TaxID=3366264 RepID=UPI003BCB0324
MKRVLFILLSAIASFSVFAQPTSDLRNPVKKIHLEGYVQNRLQSSIQNRILAQDFNRLVEVFNPSKRTETHQWQSEFWGKWFTSAVLAYQFQPSEELYETLEKAVYGLIEYQTADGYIGNYADTHRLQQWDIWGRKYCMLGLLAFYELKQDKKVLKAAEQLAQSLMDDLDKVDGIIVTKGNYRGMAASSILEPMCQLYTKTKNKKYLDFAEQIVNQWSREDGPKLIEKSAENVASRFPKPTSWYSWEQGQKAYEMMSCYEGLLELYRLTGKENYKEAVLNVWENINLTEINIAGSGASTEMWFGGKAIQAQPIHHFQEVCVTVTWIKLSLQLFRLTGDSKFAEAAETAYYNALLGSLSYDGALWAKYTPLNGQRLPGSEQCGMGLNCCEASGPRALFLWPFYAVTAGQEGIQINYFIPGTYEVEVNKQKIQVAIQTDYPKSGAVRVKLSSKKPISTAVQIRVPSWSKQTSVALNRAEVQDEVKAGTYYVIDRQWKQTDEVQLNLEMEGRWEEIGDEFKSYAIMRGPIVLARDAAFGEAAPVGINLNPLNLKDHTIKLTEVNPTNKVWMQYQAELLPESYSEKGAQPLSIMLCDYASAGYSKENSLIQTWFPALINKSK